jgi:protein-tyrosine phosphatase
MCLCINIFGLLRRALMFRKSIIFHLSLFCTSLFASQTFSYQLDNCVSWINLAVTPPEISAHFTTVRDQVQARWQAFQTNRIFKPFEIGKSDSILEEEFENIRCMRSFIWTTAGYELAQHLIDADLIRAPGCVAFAYNNTVPYYNASTMCLNNQCHLACEGPRSKDIPKFFDLLATHRVTHLVRLTDSYEGDTKKCHPYWEGRLSESSDGKQQLNIPTEHGMYSIRAFDMAYWRDNQGVDPEQLLALVLQVRREVTDSNGLLLVHCSAGVGRTGTFLAALAIVDAIDRYEPFSIEEIVYRLSLQRVYSVGKYSQYITLHRLAESYLREKSSKGLNS